MTRITLLSGLCMLALSNLAIGDGLIPIARWDTVPYQRIDQQNSLKIGVVAFSKGEIDKVVFTVTPPSGATYTGTNPVEVTQMSLNDQSGVYEYWTELEAVLALITK